MNPEAKNQNNSKSYVANLIAEIKKDDNFGKAVEAIFLDEKNPSAIKDKTISLLQEYLKTKQGNKSDLELAKQNKQIERDINKVFKRVISISTKRKKLQGSSPQNKNLDDNQAKKDFERIIKSFIVYKIYAAMNPKPIAGEPKLANRKNNEVIRGRKFAIKYEGGKKADLRKYGSREVARIKMEATQIRKGKSFSR